MIQADQIAIEKVERTLRAWHMTVEDIQALHAEARELHSKYAVISADRKRSWGRVAILAPMDGILSEKNVVAKDIVQQTSVLFNVIGTAAPEQ
jgi:multidrug resistance efflux pump